MPIMLCPLFESINHIELLKDRSHFNKFRVVIHFVKGHTLLWHTFFRRKEAILFLKGDGTPKKPGMVNFLNTTLVYKELYQRVVKCKINQRKEVFLNGRK